MALRLPVIITSVVTGSSASPSLVVSTRPEARTVAGKKGVLWVGAPFWCLFQPSGSLRHRWIDKNYAIDAARFVNDVLPRLQRQSLPEAGLVGLALDTVPSDVS